MIVVSDTSPLNYLILIGEARLLPTLFERVVIPPAVLHELLQTKAPTAVSEWLESPPDWLEVVEPVRIDSNLSLGLGGDRGHRVGPTAQC